jgi:hypothetical protein
MAGARQYSRRVKAGDYDLGSASLARPGSGSDDPKTAILAANNLRRPTISAPISECVPQAELYLPVITGSSGDAPKRPGPQ